MVAPRIVKAEDAEVHSLHGDGKIRRLVYPGTVGSERIFIGIADVGPGEAPHVFHKHGVEIHADVRLEYAPDFEEFYFVVEGEGRMQWYGDTGLLHEEPVSAGDAIYMPRDCDSHRIVNAGSSRLRVLYGGTPPARITRLLSDNTAEERAREE